MDDASNRTRIALSGGAEIFVRPARQSELDAAGLAVGALMLRAAGGNANALDRICEISPSFRWPDPRTAEAIKAACDRLVLIELTIACADWRGFRDLDGSVIPAPTRDLIDMLLVMIPGLDAALTAALAVDLRLPPMVVARPPAMMQ